MLNFCQTYYKDPKEAHGYHALFWLIFLSCLFLSQQAIASGGYDCIADLATYDTYEDTAEDMQDTFIDITETVTDLIVDTLNGENSNTDQHKQTVTNALESMTTRWAEEHGKQIDALQTQFLNLQRKKEKIDIARTTASNSLSCQTSGGTQDMIISESAMEKRVNTREEENNDIQSNKPGTYAEKGTLSAITNSSIKRRRKYCNFITYNKFDPADVMAGNFTSPLERYCFTDLEVLPIYWPVQIDADRSPFRTLLNNRYLSDGTNGALDPLDINEQEFANDLINVMTSPFVSDPVRGQALQSPDGMVKERLIGTKIARSNLSSGILQRMKELRSPTKDNTMGDWAKSMMGGILAGSPASIQNEFALLTDDASLYQTMEILYSTRMKNAYYMNWVQKQTPENVNRELLNLMSLQLTLQWEQFRMMEMMSAVNGTQLAVDVENSFGEFSPNLGGGGSTGLYESLEQILDVENLDERPELKKAILHLNEATRISARPHVPAPGPELIVHETKR